MITSRLSWLFNAKYLITAAPLSTDIRSKMSLKFSANLNFMFQEIPTLCARYQAAKDSGFKYVECGYPYGVKKGEITASKKNAGIEQVMINAHSGDREKGELGLAAIPGREEEFKEKLELSIEYANSLQCKRVHVMAGKITGEHDISDMEKTYINNLKYTADRFQKENIIGLIEVINTRVTSPKYFLGNYDKAIEYLQTVNHPNLKLEMDLFHLQIMDGNLTNNIKRLLPYTGHIQISQVPNRGEPDTPGEINYKYILQLLEKSDYDGYIGLEYKPTDGTVKGLSWLKSLGYTL